MFITTVNIYHLLRHTSIWLMNVLCLVFGKSSCQLINNHSNELYVIARFKACIDYSSLVVMHGFWDPKVHALKEKRTQYSSIDKFREHGAPQTCNVKNIGSLFWNQTQSFRIKIPKFLRTGVFNCDFIFFTGSLFPIETLWRKLFTVWTKHFPRLQTDYAELTFSVTQKRKCSFWSNFPYGEIVWTEILSWPWILTPKKKNKKAQFFKMVISVSKSKK